MDINACNELAGAIVRQAVDDWRSLCMGAPETKHCNFGELTQFFKTECGKYLVNTDIDAAEILKLLNRERKITAY